MKQSQFIEPPQHRIDSSHRNANKKLWSTAKRKIEDNRPEIFSLQRTREVINSSSKVMAQRNMSAAFRGKSHPTTLQRAVPTTAMAVAQLMTIHATGNEANPSYDFTVLKNDLNKGTNTTKETREYVNSWAAIPGTVNYSYEIYDVNQGDKKVDQDSGSTANPNPMKIGQNWDAGHSLGRQNGGLGDDKDWVFPQNPQFNRGNSYFGQKTYQDWRYCENVFHNSVYQYGKGRWKVWLT